MSEMFERYIGQDRNIVVVRLGMLSKHFSFMSHE